MSVEIGNGNLRRLAELQRQYFADVDRKNREHEADLIKINREYQADLERLRSGYLEKAIDPSEAAFPPQALDETEAVAPPPLQVPNVCLECNADLEERDKFCWRCSAPVEEATKDTQMVIGASSRAGQFRPQRR